jgi:hypothetical protein
MAPLGQRVEVRFAHRFDDTLPAAPRVPLSTNQIIMVVNPSSVLTRCGVQPMHRNRVVSLLSLRIARSLFRARGARTINLAAQLYFRLFRWLPSIRLAFVLRSRAVVLAHRALHVNRLLLLLLLARPVRPPLRPTCDHAMPGMCPIACSSGLR